MSSESPPSRNPAGHGGLLDNTLGLLSAIAEFFESRFALAAKESKSAALQIAIMVGCVIGALALCIMGYVFLIVSAVVGLAHLLGIGWPWVALMVALLHFIIAGALLVVARTRITKPMFRDTRDELKKDREWLKTLSQQTS
ncbi:MAG TPA: phage holin family protein [Chthoniobacterales bacterium]|nr:phage holin family protein [Chthoniobacterales bacterium]